MERPGEREIDGWMDMDGGRERESEGGREGEIHAEAYAGT